MKRCVVFGAAPVEDADILQKYLCADVFYIAADGGGKLATKLGVVPAMTVTDHDSSSAKYDQGECVLLPVEKDVTDTRAAMDIAFQRGYRDFLLLGCLGGRMDHTVANLLSARQLTELGARVTLADAKNELTVLLPGAYPLKAEGFSVFAMTEKVEGLTLSGVQYPLNGFTLTLDNPLCVSNRVIAEDAALCFDSGVLLLIFAND